VIAIVTNWRRPPAFVLAAAFLCAGQLLASDARAQNKALAEKIQLCSACHGEDGNSKMEKIPSLAGQPAFFILNQLFLMREGVRKVEAMAPIVKDLKDDDLTNLSQHFAALAPKRSDEAVDAALAIRARRSRCSGAAAPVTCRPWPVRSRCRGWRVSASII